MPHDDLLFLHPLLGTDGVWSGCLVENAPQADAASVLARFCRHPQIGEFDHRMLWFVPALPGLTEALPLENAVHVLPGQAVEALDGLEESLRKSGRKLGLRALPAEKLPMPGTWNYLTIDISHARSLPPLTLVGLSRRTTVIATTLRSHADHDWAMANGCQLTTTDFLLTRDIHGRKADVTQFKLLELLALVADDADNSALEAIFRQEPKLAYSLLRLVNSAAIAPRSPITSFGQAITLLGRRQLQRWLQLLVFADLHNGQVLNPLLQKAAARGRLLELLAPKLQPPPAVACIEDAAFMVGVFSLLDVLLNMPMPEILKQLPLHEQVNMALADYAGPLGAALRIIEAADKRDLDTAARRLGESSIDSQSYLDAQLAALSWAAKIRPIA